MEEMKKINDNILDEVSGGTGEKPAKVWCPYCNRPHYLRRTGNEQVFFDGNLYYEWHCDSCDVNFWNQNNAQ